MLDEFPIGCNKPHMVNTAEYSRMQTINIRDTKLPVHIKVQICQ